MDKNTKLCRTMKQIQDLLQIIGCVPPRMGTVIIQQLSLVEFCTKLFGICASYDMTCLFTQNFEHFGDVNNFSSMIYNFF